MASVTSLCILIALAFSGALSQNLDCRKVGFPKELTGVWTGDDVFLSEEGNGLNDGLDVCPSIISRRGAAASWIESCDEGVYSVEDTYIEMIQSFECTGKGTGTFIDYEIHDQEYHCTSFKVEGKTQKQVYGVGAETIGEVVCPPLDGELGEDPTVDGVIELTISDEDDLVDEEDWTCQDVEKVQ